MPIAPEAVAEPAPGATHGSAPDDTAKASVARLVAHFLLHEIDEAGLEVLRKPDMLEILEKLEPGCSEYLDRDWGRDDFELAAADYCSLFVLPKGAPPFASAWLGGSPDEHGPRLLALIRQVAAQLETAVGFDNLPVDHLGILLSLWAEAVERTASEAAAVVEMELLRPVVDSFCWAARDRSSNVFYRATASLLGQLFQS